MKVLNWLSHDFCHLEGGDYSRLITKQRARVHTEREHRLQQAGRPNLFI